ncbi:hypothetical protein Tco_1164953 [Tanacetum coccineum]
MHNNIMAVGSKDHPPMLATWRYAQWELPKPSTTTQEAVPEHTVPETYGNTTSEKRAYIDVEAKAIHMKLSGIGDGIYSTIDACTIAKELWIAIERLQNANPLALVAAAQYYPDDTYYQAPKPHKTHTSSSRHTTSTSSHATKRCKGKDIAKPTTPPSESASKEDNDPEHAQRDKDMQKNLALIAKYIKNIYKPTNNNLRTSSNTRNKNVATSSRTRNNRQTGSLGIRGQLQLLGLGKLNVIPNSSDMCDNEEEDDQYVDDHEDERVALANLTANLKLDIDENKMTQNQLRKANATLTYFHFEVNHLKYAQTNH